MSCFDLMNNTDVPKGWLFDNSFIIMRVKSFVIKNILSVFLICVFSMTASAQSYRFRHYGREWGLSNLNVNCAIQDSKGFVWVGTSIGLNRFDGSRFHTFFASEKTANALPSNTVTALAEGEDGILWIGTNNGLCSFSSQFDQFVLVDNKELGAGIFVYDLTFDRKGRLWVNTVNGLVKYNPLDGKSVAYSDSQVSRPVNMVVSENGGLWVASSNGQIYSYDERKDSFTKYIVFQDNELNNKVVVKGMTELPDGSFALVTDRMQGKVFYPATARVENLFPQESIPSDVFVHTILCREGNQGDGQLWIGTEEGIYVYDMREKLFSSHLHKRYGDPYSISDDAVHVLASDREDGVWVGTFFGGMNYVPNESEEMFDLIQPLGNGDDSMARVVREMAVDLDGILWVGTEDGGLFKMENGSTSKTRGLSSSICLRPVSLDWQGHSISRNIQTLMVDGQNLWVGTFDEGVYIIDTRSSKIIENIRNGDRGLKSNAIVRLFRTPDGTVFLGTMSNGMFVYDRDTQTFHHVKGREQGFIHDIYVDSRGRLWVADINRGIFLAENVSSPMRHVFVEQKSATTIYEDENQQMWFGSSSNGLYSIDSKGNLCQPLPELARSGLGIYKMAEDAEGRIWISTSDGLYNYDKSGVSRYGTDNGLPTDQFDFNSGLTDSTGRMYFGTLNGLVSFTPSSAHLDNNKLKVLFTGLMVEGRNVTHQTNPEILKESLLFANEIHLNHDQSSISIDFACPLYSVPQAIWYRYRLEGLDKDWTVCKGAQRLNFAGLSPGTYTLSVQASRQNGQWSDFSEASTIIIVVHQPWWLSGWAVAAYIILATLLGLFLYRHIIRRKNERQRIENERMENERYRDVLQSKIKFFTTITHEIRTPLSLIMGSIERLEKTVDEKTLQPLRRNSQRLLDLVNQLLDFRKIESSQFLLNFLPLNVTELLIETCEDFMPAARQKGITFKHEFSKEISPMVMADREAMTKIFSNLMSNAMKFCEKMVSVNLEIVDSQVMIRFENDGPRIPTDQLEEIFKPFYQYYGTQTNATIKGSGLGLPLARSLAEMHNGTLSYNDKEIHTNCFLLQLPIIDFSSAQSSSDSIPPSETVYSDGTDVAPNNDNGVQEEGSNEDKPTILVVDDEVELRDFVCEELSDSYSIIQADNGKQALQLMEKHNISLVLTDIMMPVMNGMELCNRMKNDIRFCHIPVLVLTAKVSRQDHLEALESKADAYIEKPFSVVQLKAQIANLITNRRLIMDSVAHSPHAQLTSVASNSMDEKFLDKLNTFIEENMSDSSLNVDSLAQAMNMSNSTLYRKVKALTSFSPNDFIRLCRLKEAASMLSTGEYRIKEVASQTGFSSVAYFTTCFMRQFGITPGAFMKQ